MNIDQLRARRNGRCRPHWDQLEHSCRLGQQGIIDNTN
jgi:hypothetical protein